MRTIPASYVRLYADEAGESHFEDCAVELAPAHPDAPGGIFLAPFGAAPRTYWGGLPASASEPPHPAPRAELFCVVRGRCRATASDGEERMFGPGDVIVLEDVTGKGHATAVVGDEDLVWFGVELPG